MKEVPKETKNSIETEYILSPSGKKPLWKSPQFRYLIFLIFMALLGSAVFKLATLKKTTNERSYLEKKSLLQSDGNTNEYLKTLSLDSTVVTAPVDETSLAPESDIPEELKIFMINSAEGAIAEEFTTSDKKSSGIRLTYSVSESFPEVYQQLTEIAAKHKMIRSTESPAKQIAYLELKNEANITKIYVFPKDEFMVIRIDSIRQ